VSERPKPEMAGGAANPGWPLRVVPVPGKGRGVVALRAFAKDELVERAPCIVIAPHDWAQVEPTALYHYAFAWGPQGDHAAYALGYGSLYNHSYTPAARYERREAERCIDIIAVRDIAAGEEVTINYNGDPDDQTPVWFDVK
jgi:uncharacterized protein